MTGTTPSRDCGGCTACCKLMGIPELEKPAGEWCEFVDIHTHSSCTIYEDRPKSCRKFRCLWLQEDYIPKKLRPDKSGVMMVLYPKAEEDNATLRVWETRPNAHKKPEIYSLIQILAASGTEVKIHAFNS